jgi:hypothetical protein
MGEHKKAGWEMATLIPIGESNTQGTIRRGQEREKNIAAVKSPRTGIKSAGGQPTIGYALCLTDKKAHIAQNAPFLCLFQTSNWAQ